MFTGCRSIPVILSSAHNFQPISSQHCQRHRGTSNENKQSEWGKDTNSYFPCAFRVYGESYVCTAGVRCGRWDLGMTSVQFPSYYRASQVGATREEFPECMEIFHTLGELSPSGHVCCSVSPCGQELVRGERGISIKTKLSVYRAVVLPSLLYGCETWTCYRRHTKKLDQFHLRCLRKVLRVSWKEHVPNQEILRSAELTGIEAMLN